MGTGADTDPRAPPGRPAPPPNAGPARTRPGHAPGQLSAPPRGPAGSAEHQAHWLHTPQSQSPGQAMPRPRPKRPHPYPAPPPAFQRPSSRSCKGCTTPLRITRFEPSKLSGRGHAPARSHAPMTLPNPSLKQVGVTYPRLPRPKCRSALILPKPLRQAADHVPTHDICGSGHALRNFFLLKSTPPRTHLGQRPPPISFMPLKRWAGHAYRVSI